MNNETKTKSDELLNTKSNINKATTSAVGSSLLGRIQKMKQESAHNLLIDVSGSMEDLVVQDGQSRYEATTKRAILEELLTKLPEGITKFAFSLEVKEFKGTLPFEGRGTRMDYAFLKMKDLGKQEIVLITDGMPDDEDKALAASRGLKIDIIYIGPQPRPEFLEKLAHKTSGSFTNINLVKAGATKELGCKVQLLLGA